MKTYQSYKPSGVEWIGDIPDYWVVGRWRYYFSSGMGQTILKEDLIENGEIPVFSATEGNNYFGYVNKSNLILENGDIVIPARGNSIGYVKIVNEKSTTTQTTIYSKRRSNKINPNFIYYYSIGKKKLLFPFVQTAIPQITVEEINSNYIIIPPLQEQEQIVKYLDDKTSIIDKLISTKERKIELLKEQRSSLINEVITKGLDPNVKMKDSGVEWIGEIPESWVIGKLKHNTELRISSIDKHIYDYEREVIVCNYTDVYYNEFITNELELRVGSCSEDEFNKFKLNNGDVIITKDSESPTDIGVPSLVKCDFENVVCGYHLSIIKPLKNKLIGGFLFRQLQTKRVRSYYEVNSNGITRFGLGKSSVLDTPMIIPPIQEQQQIVEYLDKHTKEIDDLVQLEQKKIELLKEYRQSLISEVITGKIKVVE